MNAFDTTDLYYINNNFTGTRKSLFELAKWKNGLAFKNIDFSETGKPIIKIAELNNGISSSTAFSNKEYSREVHLIKGDLVFSWSGNPQTSIDIFRYNLPDGWLNQHIFKVTPFNEIVDKDFFFYIMKFLKPTFTAIATNKQTTGLGHVTITDLKRISLQIPPLFVQKKIAGILKSLDDKIELNRQISKNLEEQARCLFNEQFDKANDLLPDGWQIADIYSIANVIYGAPFASNLFNTEGNGKPIIRIRDLQSQNFTTYTTENHPKGYLLQRGDIVVGMDGEFRPYIWGNDEAWLNQRICVFENKRPKGKFFLYFTLLPLLNFIEETEMATTVIHIGKKDFDAFRIILPDEKTLNNYDELTMPMFEQIVANKKEIAKLTQIRDTILPKLMCGEIEV